MALNITDVVNDYGAFYKPGSDNQKNLRTMLYKPTETTSIFQPRPTTDTIYRGTLASISRVLQPFQKAFTSLSTTTFLANPQPLFKLKIDAAEYPDELEPSYLGFLADMEEADRSKWPFGRWWVENLIIPKSKEDCELNECFGGVFVQPTPGTPGAAGTAMNGIRKIMIDFNTDGRLNLGNGPIAMGAVPGADADFCTYVEEFVAALPTHFRDKIDLVVMSKAAELKYKRGKRAKYGAYFNMVESPSLYTIEDFPNAKVKGLESHSGSDLIWSTIAVNRINPKKKGALADTLALKEFAARQVSAYTDWWEVCTFEVPEFVFTTDQGLAA